MSVLISIADMEMPKSCHECPLLYVTSLCDGFKDCPIVPVPPHGRLIEENDVLAIVSEYCPDDDGSVGKVADLREMLDEIEALSPVIPASEKEEH